MENTIREVFVVRAEDVVHGIYTKDHLPEAKAECDQDQNSWVERFLLNSKDSEVIYESNGGDPFGVMKEADKDFTLRDSLLSPFFAKADEYFQSRLGIGSMGYSCGGTRNYMGLTLDVLKELYRQGFASEGPWNNCPGNQAFLEFLEKHPSWTAHGYAVSPDRNDVRITIEGLEKKGNLGLRELADFNDKFGEADEFEAGGKYARCWYD